MHTNILEQQGRVIAFEDVCLCVYFSMLSLRATRARWGGTTLAELSGHVDSIFPSSYDRQDTIYMSGTTVVRFETAKNTAIEVLCDVADT